MRKLQHHQLQLKDVATKTVTGGDHQCRFDTRLGYLKVVLRKHGPQSNLRPRYELRLVSVPLAVELSPAMDLITSASDLPSN